MCMRAHCARATHRVKQSVHGAGEYALMDAAEARMWWYCALHARLADALGGVAGRVLDAGCGTGGLLAVLRDRPGLALVGLEFAQRQPTGPGRNPARPSPEAVSTPCPSPTPRSTRWSRPTCCATPASIRKRPWRNSSACCGLAAGWW